jgi:hypothetical protein
LILWNSGKKRIFASIIPTQAGHASDSMWNWNTFEVPGLILVAGGGHRIAGISKVFWISLIWVKMYWNLARLANSKGFLFSRHLILRHFWTQYYLLLAK